MNPIPGEVRDCDAWNATRVGDVAGNWRDVCDDQAHALISYERRLGGDDIVPMLDKAAQR
jgi:hypothetical protein